MTASAESEAAWVLLPGDEEILVWREHPELTLSRRQFSPDAWVTFCYGIWSCANSEMDAPPPPPPPCPPGPAGGNASAEAVASLGPPVDGTALRGNDPVRLCISDVEDVLQRVMLEIPADGGGIWACLPAKSWAAAAAQVAAAFVGSDLLQSSLLVRLDLVSVESSKAAYILNKAIVLKKEGTDSFKSENWSRAAAFYKAALRFVLDAHGLLSTAESCMNSASAEEMTTEAKEAFDLRTTLHLNMASCHLNRGAPQRAASRCTKALLLDPANSKSLVRRAKAWGMLGRHSSAIEDLECAQHIVQRAHECGQNVDGALAGKVAKLLARAKRMKRHAAKPIQ